MGPRITVSLVSAVALGLATHAEDEFQKLTGAQIQAKFSGMKLTDQVHWGDVHQTDRQRQRARRGTIVPRSTNRSALAAR